MKIEIFVQARMGSTRLPGKVMMQVLGKPLLGHLLERLKVSREANAVVVLTSSNPEDNVIERFCHEEGVLCFRGPEEDVLTRFHLAAKKRLPDAIVRITADCPLMDPEIVDNLIRTYRDTFPKYDYISNTMERTFPRGLDVEIVSFKALDRAFKEALEASEREHVTMYFYRHPEIFHLYNIASQQLASLSRLRWTVDTSEDFALIQLIIENLYPNNPNFRFQDIVDLLAIHPDWSQLNAHIQQKT